MKVYIVSLLLLVGVLLAFGQTTLDQGTYPYPQPKPTNGLPPTNVAIYLGFPIAPGNYANNRPAVWDTDVGGGLQSRTNEADRFNAKWLRYGSIVFDQTDKTYYGADIFPGTNHLRAWRPLFTLDGLADTSIYKGDGSLENNRVVNLTNFSLTFEGAGGMSMNPATLSMITPSWIMLQSSSVDLLGANNFRIRTPGVFNGAVSNGWFLKLVDKNTGQAEFAAVPPTGTNGIPVEDTSIYKADGLIESPRTVHLTAKPLSFNGGGAGSSFNITNVASIDARALDVSITGTNNMFLRTPKVNSGSGVVGDILVLTNVNGKVEFTKLIHPTFNDTNIYNDNGSLSSFREINGAGHGMNFSAMETFSVSTDGTGGYINLATVGINDKISIQTKAVIDGTAKAGWALTKVQDDAGWVEFAPILSTNIYNRDGNVSDDRTVNGTSTGIPRDLRFINFDDFNVIAQDVILAPQFTMRLQTPGLSSADNGYVLTLDNDSNGTVEFHPARNIYNIDGTMLSHRTVDGAGKNIGFTNFASIGSRAQTNTLTGSAEFKMFTPSFFSGPLPTNGSVLTLLDNSLGRVDFRPPAFPPEDKTVYTHDGTNTSSRSMTIPTNMYFRTIGEGDVILNSARNNLSAKTNFLIGSDRTLVSAVTNLQIRGPRINQGISPPTAGMPLTLLDPATGQVEYHPPNNLGNSNQTLTATRYVEGNNFSMVVRGMNIHQVDAGYALIRGTNEVRLTTPGIFGGGKSAGMFLKLINAGSGTAEWDSITNGAPANTIYTANDSITSDRTVNQNSKFLLFNASNTSFVVTNAGHAKILATTNWITATNKFILTTPAVYWDGAAAHAGKYLKLNPDGTSEFATVGATNDATIYNTSGTLMGNRVVEGGGMDLTFHNIDALTNAALTQVINGLSLLQIKTPNFQSSTSSLAVGQTLTLQDATTGRVEFQANPTNNIYNRDGNLTGTRTMNLNANSLTIRGSPSGGSFFVTDATVADISSTNTAGLSSHTTRIAGTNSLRIVTPNSSKSLSTPGQYLMLTAGDGSAEWTAPPGSQNIYNTSSNLTGNRNVGLNNNTLNFNGNGNVNFNMSGGNFGVSGGSSSLIYANNLAAIGSSTILRLETPRVFTTTDKPTQGQVMLAEDSTGKAEWRPLTNLYNYNGSLSSDRTVNGSGNSLAFAGGMNNFIVDAFNVNLAGHTALYLQTPNTFSSSAKDGHVLTIKAGGASTGNAEWQAIPTVPTLYNTNSFLLGPRIVSFVGNPLTFNGGGASGDFTYNGGGGDFTYNATGGNFNVSGTTSSSIQASGAVTLQTGSSGSIKLKTPLVVGSTPPPTNSVLKLINQDGSVEFGPAPPTGGPSFYQEDGEIDDDFRTVNGGSGTLTFNNLLALNLSAAIFDQNASQTEIQGSSQLRIKTPNFGTTNLQNGQVLTMVDKNSGRVEFQTSTLTSPIFFTATGYMTDYTESISPSLAITNMVPPWPYSFANYPPTGTRISVYVYSDTSNGHNDGFVTGVNVTFPGSSDVWSMRDSNYEPLDIGQLRDRMIMDIGVFNRDGTGQGSLAFLNNTLQATNPEAGLAARQGTSNVTVVTSAGVVDTFLDLAGAPASFKKISTLGFATVGDGKHGDYYLTAIDLTAPPGTWIQSNTDPQKMWRQLIPR